MCIILDRVSQVVQAGLELTTDLGSGTTCLLLCSDQVILQPNETVKNKISSLPSKTGNININYREMCCGLIDPTALKHWDSLSPFQIQLSSTLSSLRLRVWRGYLSVSCGKEKLLIVLPLIRYVLQDKALPLHSTSPAAEFWPFSHHWRSSAASGHTCKSPTRALGGASCRSSTDFWLCHAQRPHICIYTRDFLPHPLNHGCKRKSYSKWLS